MAQRPTTSRLSFRRALCAFPFNAFIAVTALGAGPALAQSEPPPRQSWFSVHVASGWFESDDGVIATTRLSSVNDGTSVDVDLGGPREPWTRRQNYFLNNDGDSLAGGRDEFRITPSARAGCLEIYHYSGSARTACPMPAGGANAWQADLIGAWDTTLGRLELHGEINALHGTLERTTNGHGPTRHRIAIVRSGSALFGLVTLPSQQFGDNLTIRIEGDGSISGVLWDGGDGIEWTGRRAAETKPDPDPQPRPDPQPQPDPGPGPGSEAPESGFQSAGAFDIRLEALERPRGVPVVRALVTIRNVSQQVQYPASLRAILTDADGATQERNQLWRATGEPASVFGSTPALEPDAELRVRYTFNPDIRGLRSVTLQHGQDRATFSLEGR